MLPVLLQSIVLAAGGILSVGSITIVILLLLSDRGWHNGLAYVLGYVSAYTLIGLSLIWIGGVAGTSSGESGSFSAFLLVALGLLLLWLALRNWRKPPSTHHETPRIFTLLDKITPGRAFGFGALVTVINFKNLAIFLSAVSVPLLSNLALPAKLIIVLLDVFVFCTAVIIPVLIYVLFPQQANERLNWIKQTLEQYSRPIGIGVPLLFGIIFLIRGFTVIF